MRWYVLRGGQTSGPFEEETVRGWGRAGQMAGAAVSQEGGGHWIAFERSALSDDFARKRWVTFAIYLPVFLVAFGAIGLWMLLFGLGTLGALLSDQETATAQETIQPSAPRAVNVDPGTLVDAYQENQVAADQKYKGKRLRVYGPVDSVTNGMFGGVDVSIRPRGFFSVSCHFRAADQRIAGLRSGSYVTMVGSCRNGTTLGVHLQDCVLE
jgi:hypothetical protein